MARKRAGSGEVFARSAEAMAQIIVDQLTQQSVLAVLETVFGEEEGFDLPAEDLARHVLIQRGLKAHRGLLRLDAGLDVPVIGLGASAPTYYPAIGKALGARVILPPHTDVANAIGAVVGRVTMRRSGVITAPGDGVFRVHLQAGLRDFADQDAAFAALEAELTAQVFQAARDAGAVDAQLSLSRDVKTAEIETRQVFIEATVTAEATGRARFADG